MMVFLATATAFLFLYNPHGTPAEVVVLDRATEVSFHDLDGTLITTQSDVALSHDWRIAAPAEARQPGGLIEGRYTLPFYSGTQDSGPQMVLIPRFARTIELWVNDQPVPGALAGDGETQWDWYKPLLLAVPEGALHPGENRLEVRVRASFQSTAGLSRVFIGPAHQVDQIYNRLEFLQKRLPPIANLITLTLSLPLFLIWLNGRRARADAPFAIYGLLASAMAVFALRSLHVYVEEAPIPMPAWIALVTSSLAWAVGLFSVFILRFVGVRAPRIEWSIGLFVVLSSLALFAFPDSLFSTYRTLFVYVPVTAFGIASIGVACTVAVRAAGPPGVVRDRFLMSLSLLLIVPTAIHDLLWVRGLLEFEAVLWLPIIMPTMMLAISVIVANRYAETWVSAHELNHNLRHRIAEARAEIRETYSKRIEAERRAGIANERAQLVEELHDGVGNRLSLLLTALRTSSVPVEESVRWVDSCLQDLRMIITARDLKTLGDALSELCWQHSTVLERQGIALTLDCDAEARALRLDATRTLDVLRIVQEAISNATRHSQSSRIEVTARLVPARGLSLRIRNFASPPAERQGAERPVSGRGLMTMRSRAGRLGGELEILQDAAGWTILFEGPVIQAQEPAVQD
ncbi:MAG: sensor histidine kinase [Pararhodobacter sp.]